MIRVQQELLETPGVTQDVVGDAGQGAMTFVDVFHLPVTPFKNRNAPEHGITTTTSSSYSLPLSLSLSLSLSPLFTHVFYHVKTRAPYIIFILYHG